jgi:hypothetical protein
VSPIRRGLDNGAARSEARARTRFRFFWRWST